MYPIELEKRKHSDFATSTIHVVDKHLVEDVQDSYQRMKGERINIEILDPELMGDQENFVRVVARTDQPIPERDFEGVFHGISAISTYVTHMKVKLTEDDVDIVLRASIRGLNAQKAINDAIDQGRSWIETRELLIDFSRTTA